MSLKPGVIFEAKVYARNKYGWSDSSLMFEFSTASTGVRNSECNLPSYWYWLKKEFIGHMKEIADCGFLFFPDEAFEESYQETDEDQKEITGLSWNILFLLNENIIQGSKFTLIYRTKSSRH